MVGEKLYIHSLHEEEKFELAAIRKARRRSPSRMLAQEMSLRGLLAAFLTNQAG